MDPTYAALFYFSHPVCETRHPPLHLPPSPPLPASEALTRLILFGVVRQSPTAEQCDWGDTCEKGKEERRGGGGSKGGKGNNPYHLFRLRGSMGECVSTSCTG